MKKLVALHLLTLAASFASGPYVTGSFVTFDRNFTAAMWQQELAAQSALGHKILVLPADGILMPSAQDPTGFTVNPQTLIYPSAIFPANPPRPDNLGMLLTAADQFGMQVYIGSLLTADTWSNGDEFNALHKFDPIVAQEILALYGHHPSLNAGAGNWYFAPELWLNWVKYYGPGYYGINELATYAAHMKAINQRARIIAAPVFKQAASGVMPGLTPSETGAWLATLVADSQVSIVAPQDGAGAQSGAPPISALASYYSAMQAALERPIDTGAVQLWTTLETFQTAAGSTESANGWQPAPLARIRQQLAAEAPYVSQILEFIYEWDMSPQATYTPVEADTLHAQFATGATSLTGYAVSYSIPPSPYYPDAAPSKLTNGTGGGFGEALTRDWVAFAGNPTGTVTITVDLGAARTITGVHALFAGSSQSGIDYPQSVAAEYSRDGVSWFPLSRGTTPETPPLYAVTWVDATSPTPATASQIRITVNFTEWLFIGEIKTIN